MPLIPKVKTRPPATTGVDFGPGPVPARRRIHRVRCRVLVAPQLLAAREIDRARHFAIALARMHDHTAAATTGDECPAPTVASQRFVRVVGQVAGVVS